MCTWTRQDPKVEEKVPSKLDIDRRTSYVAGLHDAQETVVAAAAVAAAELSPPTEVTHLSLHPM